MTQPMLLPKTVSRRRLLIRAIGAALASCGGAWTSGAVGASDVRKASGLGADTQTLPSDQDDPNVEHWDVVVVGSGTAGLCAAIAAREAGARRVVILEKHAMTGGHGIVSSGSVAVAQRRPQTDDPEREIREMTAEILEAGGETVKPELAEKLARESESAVAWLGGMGVDWRPVRYRAVGSVSARNISTGSPQAGYDYVSALAHRAKTVGIEIRHQTRAVRLLTAKNRRTGEEIVVGVTATQKVPETETKTKLQKKPQTNGAERLTAPGTPHALEKTFRLVDFRAPAVVLATGGFTANVGMRMKYVPRLDATYPTTANPRGFLLDGAEGDGIRMAEALGAKLIGMEYIQLIPYSGGRLLDFVGGEIWVNDEGLRFVSEGVPFGELARVVEEMGGRSFWAISDGATQKGASLGVKLEEGIVREASSIESMAHGMGVPVPTLKETIQTWNEDVRRGWDSKFGRPLHGVPIERPPFYYGRETWSVHFTCGGVAIDTEARVWGEDDRPIPGLFAAGEVTGGVHGRDRLGGHSMTDTFVFGRTAGRSAAVRAQQAAGSAEDRKNTEFIP